MVFFFFRQNSFLVFLVDLESIIYLIKFLQFESVETEEESKKILNLVNTVIQTSHSLREKIEKYLYRLKIDIEQFHKIQFIISSISTSFILYKIQRKELLNNLLINSQSKYSYEFFKQWFYSFLVFKEESNEINKKEYQDLLLSWSNQFTKYHETTMKILTDLDELINTFNNQQYQSVFIQHMIHLCFRQSKSNSYHQNK